MVDAKTDFRFQLGLSKNVPWVEYDLGNDVHVKRFAGIKPPEQKLIDIADRPPQELPSNQGVNLSVYCDPSGFMEIEACGGCPETLVPNTELSVKICTEYKLN